MKTGWVVIGTVVVTLVVLIFSGCAEFVNVDEYEQTLDAEDVIAMSKAGVGSVVIIRKIEVSRSRFSLDTEDIIQLKSEGVADDVIHVMIDTDEAAELVDLERSYSLYDYWFNYYNTLYPVNLYADPSFPLFPNMYYSWSQFVNPMYRWSGTLGRFYRDFPVGLPPRFHTKGH